MSLQKKLQLTLDRISLYIMLKWISLFLISAISLYSLATLGDIVNNLVRNKLTFTMILEQNLLNSSLILSSVLPVSCLLASLFLLNNLKQHSELIAILASGYSLIRMSFYICSLGIIIACMQFVNLGFWGPHLVAQKKSWKESSKLEDRAVISQNKIWIKHQSYFGYYRFFDHVNKKMIDPNLFFYNENYKASKFIKAESSVFLGDNKWRFIKAQVTENLDKNQFPTVTLHEEIIIPLYENPETIAEFQADLKSLNVISLYKFLRHISDTGINLTPYYLQVYESLSSALLCLIFTLYPFAFIMGLSSRHQSTGKALLNGLIISLAFLGLNLLFTKILLLIHMPPIFSSLLFPVCCLVYLVRRLLPKVTL